MFEEIIAQLDAMGISYNEDYETGQLMIDVAAMDKTQIIDVVSILSDSGLEFTIDEQQIIVIGGMVEAPMEEAPMDDVNYQDIALEEME